MSENTPWTPGPWTVRTLENFGFNVVHYVGGDKFNLIRVAKVGDEANARLIAAAPDMASAIQKLISAWDSRNTIAEQIVTGKTDATPQMRALEAIEEMRELLAKINGASLPLAPDVMDEGEKG